MRLLHRTIAEQTPIFPSHGLTIASEITIISDISTQARDIGSSARLFKTMEQKTSHDLIVIGGGAAR